MTHIIRTLLSGFLLLLPAVVTVILVVWLGQYIIAFVGPGSIVGHLLTVVGFGFSASTMVAYGIGVVILIGCVYVLGLLVESRLRTSLSNAVDSTMRRIPVIRNVYDLSKRFVSIVDQKDGDGLKTMSPVWCFFGGEGGAAVLALLPSPQPIELGGKLYFAILVPSAPVPVGGGLLYVPAEWVKPADIGVDGLMSVYVSMGVTAPKRIETAQTQQQPGGGKPTP